jgi:hypothetical protein
MADEETAKMMTPQEMANNVQRIVSEHMKLAFRQFKELRAQYGSPNRAAAAFMKSVYPKMAHDLIDNMNDWIDHQLDTIEENLEKRMDSEPGKVPDGWCAMGVPNAEEIQKLVNDYMKQAFKQYKDLKAQYGTPAKATIDFMRSAYPKNLRDLVENVDKWIEDRTSEMESTVERQLEKAEQRSESGTKRKK